MTHPESLTSIARSYDQVPYESVCFPFTHPARMGAVARLHGLEAPTPEHGRVLEIGCAMGQNLLPLALAYPSATFVGVDISVVQIERARASALELGIRNVTLVQGDICALQDQLEGHFDFIICHGVYSWVPPTVREGILSCCARHLAEHGVAMISFNALPGGCEFRRTRDLALKLSPAADAADAPERLRQARSALEKLLRDAPERIDAAMRGAIQTFIDAPASYAIHEYFSEHNEAFSLGMFAAQLAPHGLHYVADAQLDIDGARERFAQRSGLSTLGLSPLALEEALDAIEGNAFRRALICQRSEGLARHPETGALRAMAVACRFTDVTQPEEGTGITSPMTLQSPAGHTLRLLLPAAKQTAQHLMRLNPCYAKVSDLLADRTSAEAEIVLKTLLHLALEGFIDLVTTPLAIAPEPPDPPRLWPWAAHALRSGSVMLCGTTHEPQTITAEMRWILKAMDGQTTASKLARLWRERPGQTMPNANQQNPMQPKNETADDPPFRSLLKRLHALGAVA